MNIKTAVIPVAGQGTRFLQIPLTIPKAMIPIIDLPSKNPYPAISKKG